MSDFEDDRSAIVVPFILDRFAAHRRTRDTPFFVGLNGVQGVGKTTLVTALETALSSPPHNLPTLTLSIDDLYLPHTLQSNLAQTHPQNPLIQHRGQPGTHDLPLATSLFSQLRARAPNIRIPRYDKAAFDGQGDRAPETEWRVVNKPGEGPIEAVVFEGWCVGFRPMGEVEVRAVWEGKVAQEKEKSGGSEGRLGLQRLEDVFFVNEALKSYDALTDYFDALVHIDAVDPHYVYPWRLEAEHKLRATRGKGMTDEQVIDFINGYYPSYELFTTTLRRGVFPDEPGKQLRLVVDRERRLVSHEVI